MSARALAGFRSAAVALGALLTLTAGFGILAPRAAGATVVCGHLTGTNVWTAAGSPYYMTCHVVVDPGASLRIEAGVTVLATPGLTGGYLSVQGALVVAGTPSAAVVFDSNATSPARGDWGGITVWYTASAQIAGLVVRHANDGLNAWAPSQNGQPFVLRDSEFAFNYVGVRYGTGLNPVEGIFSGISVHHNGVGITSNATISLHDSTVLRNEQEGLATVTDLTVTNTTIADNGGDGIAINAWGYPSGGGSPAKITCSEIAGNGFGPSPGYGIEVQGSAGTNAVNVSRNNFVGNARQARDDGAGFWDDGRRGNYWSDYTGTDQDGDGFGDTPYVIDADSQDNHPYVRPVPGCPGSQPQDLPPGPAAPLDAQLTGTSLQDVTLTWALSPDDGAGENDVTAYLVYASTAFDPQGAGYMLLATLPPGTQTYTDAGVGAGNPDLHFYRLVTRDAAGQTTASSDQFAKYTERLAAGQTLLSIPVRVSDTRIDAVLQTVDWNLARTYVNPAGQGRNWLSNDRAKPWADLTDVQQGMALWLFVNRSSDLVVAGLVPASVTIRLEVGWNFVGYASFVDGTVGTSLAGARVQSVEGFDPTNGPYYLRRLADGDVLRAGDGLWVHASAPYDWILAN